MKILFRLMNLFVLVALLAACAGPAAQIGGQQSIIQSDKTRITNPNSPAADVEKLVSGNSAFAFDLYQAMRNVPGNLFYSPYSISAALAMAQAGARGETLKQINAVLHFSLADAALHPAFNTLQLALAGREKNVQDATKNDFRLNVVNATWGQAGYKFLAEYLDTLAQNYGAGLRLLDFKTDPEKSRQTINDWVAQQTEQKIKDLIAKGLITPATALVLTNAIYFNAAWLRPFNEKATSNAPFTNLDGAQVSVPTMNQPADSYNFSAGSGYQAIELPYTANKLSMLVLVPDAGKFNDFEKGLTATQVAEIRKTLKFQSVKLALPKFKIESSIGLGDTLQQMGMVDAFIGGKADLSGIDGSRSLFISSVVHKAYVDVNEAGTEAAAATAVIISKTSMPIEVIDLKIDRPFIFMIQDRESGSILFVGRVTNL